MDINKGATLASAVALLLSGGVACGSDEDSGDDVGANPEGLRCQGINECAGMAECAGPDGENACQNMNECAGMGWVTVDSEEDCTSVGGTLIDS